MKTNVQNCYFAPLLKNTFFNLNFSVNFLRILPIWLVLFATPVCAQTLSRNIPCDTLKFENGSKQAAKIIEVSDTYVKYKNPLDTLGPTFVVRRKEVKSMILKNGCLEMKQQGFDNCVKDPAFDCRENVNRTFISTDIFQLANAHFQMNIDALFKNKKQGIGFLINIGFHDPDQKETYDRMETRFFISGFYKKAYAGIHYIFFPYGSNKKVNYSCSLGVDIGQANFQQKPGINKGYTSAADALYLGYKFTNSIVCRLARHFVCQGAVSVGLHQFNYLNKENKKRANAFYGKLSPAVLIGYAF
jgi:hypothetical protein